MEMNDAISEEAVFGPNAVNIRSAATRVIKSRMPMAVRRELMAAVKAGYLGRLPKSGLMPEVFYHPDHKHGAVERQKKEAEYAVACVARVMCSPSEYRAGIEAMGGNVEEQLLSRIKP